MTHKTKTIILVVIILAATIGVGAYYVNLKNIQSQQKDQQLDQTAVKKDNSEKQAQTITASTLIGEVSIITTDSIEITKDDVKSSYVINQETPVFSVEAGKVEKKTIADIKKGGNASIMTNEADKSVLSIQLGKDAGSVF